MITPSEYSRLNADDAARLASLVSLVTTTTAKERLAKRLLIAGESPEEVAKTTELPLELVLKWFESTYNPRCRTLSRPNQKQVQQTVSDLFLVGFSLEYICDKTSLPLATVIRHLTASDIQPDDIASRMPPESHPLVVEYRKVLRNKKTRHKRVSRYRADGRKKSLEVRTKTQK